MREGNRKSVALLALASCLGLAALGAAPDQALRAATQVAIPQLPPSGGAPDIQLTGPVPVVLESVISFSTSGASTQHQFLPTLPRLGGAAVWTLIANGEYGASNETASLTVEGSVLGTVGAVGSDCIPAARSFAASAAQLDGWLANGSATAIVANTSQVAPICGTNNHTLQLTYQGADPGTPQLAFGAVAIGSTLELPLEIRNTGVTPLNVTSITSDSGEFVPSVSSLVVPPSGTALVTVSCTSTSSSASSGTLSIESDDPDEPSLTVPLSRAIPSLQVSPSSFDVQLSLGQSQSLPLTLSNLGPGNLIWTAAEHPAVGWLSLSPTAGSIAAPGSTNLNLAFTVNVPVGTYSTTLSFQSHPPTLGGGSVHVELTVVEPSIGVAPASLRSTVHAGSSQQQTLTISNGGPGTLTYSISESLSWISISPPLAGSVTAGAERDVTVTFAPGTMVAGTYNGNITISSNDPDGPVLVPVQLTVPAPSIGVAPGSLESSPLDAGQVEVHTLTVSNGGPGTLSYSVSESLSWITVSPTSGFVLPGATADLTVTFVTNGVLPGGIHNGNITLNNNDPDGPVVVPVQLHLMPSSITVTPPSLTATEPGPQTLTVSNGGPGSLYFSVSESLSWITVSPTSGGLAPGQSLSVTVTFSGATGPLSGNITVSSNDPDGPVIVPVQSQVQVSAMGATPPSLSATVENGLAQVLTLTVTNGGPATLIFTAIELTPIPWLSLAPTGGTVPNQGTMDLNVTFSPTSQAIGTHTGTIQLQDSNPSTPHVNVPVQLTVPASSMGFTPPSLSATLDLGQSEVQTLTVTNGGPGSLVFSASESVFWLSVVPSSGTVPAQGSMDLDVTLSAVNLGHGTHTTSITLTDNDPATSNLLVPVTLIRPAGELAVTPGSFQVVLDPGEETTETLSLSNVGMGTLTIVSVTGDPVPWLDIRPTSGPLAPQQTSQVEITISAPLRGVVNDVANLFVASDDPGQPVVSVPVELLVLTVPDIMVTEHPVVVESTEFYSSQSAATSHELALAADPVGGGTLEVIVEGNFGGPTEIASVVAEGEELGHVGASGPVCGTAQKTFALDPGQLMSLAADDTLQVEVHNPPDVDAFCPTNRHTVRLTYLPELTSLDFGTVAVGTSVERVLTVWNVGGLPLEVSSIATSGAGFTVAPAGLSLPTGGTAAVAVTFAPETAAASSGTLTFTSNDPDKVAVELELAGVGACLDADGDGFTACDGDCDEVDAASNPAATESCTDSVDNDCNDLSDELDERCADLLAEGLHFAAGSTSSLSWEPAAAAEHYALYRGTLSPTGFVPYDHLCRAAEVASTTALDPAEPRPSEGFYYLVTGQRVESLPASWSTGDPTPTAVLVSGPLGRASSGLSRPDSSAIPCGTRVYVDPSLGTAAPDGRSWATAYPSVAAALGFVPYPDRGLELWVRGTSSGVAVLNQGRGAVIYGGFAGNETSNGERDPVAYPTRLEGEGDFSVLFVPGKSLVLDGLTLSDAGYGVWGEPAGEHVELEGVSLEQLTAWGVQLRTIGSRLVVQGSSHDGSGLGAVHAYALTGRLDGRIRRNVFAAGASDATLRLDSKAVWGTSDVALDIVGNRIEGGRVGLRLGAAVESAAVQAVQSSFVASNVIYGTTEAGLLVEAVGNFVAGVGPALVESRPWIVGNTLSDGTGAGVIVSATRNDAGGAPELHVVQAVPELWDNLVTFHDGAGIGESSDDPGQGLVADPAAIVGNDLFGNGALYVDEGSTSLLLEEVNELAGAFDNYDGDPGYKDRLAGDFHLRYGTVLGFGTSMRYLANASDPGVGLSWTLTSFDDESWTEGVYGVGYDLDHQAATLIHTEVPPGTVSVFTRATFEIEDVAEVDGLTLGTDFDDGWVAWINGVAVGRSASMPPGAVDWNTVAASHESSNGPVPVYSELDVSPAGLGALLEGTNVLAIGVWNTGPDSSDLVLVPRFVLDVELAPIDAGHPSAPRLATEDIDGDTRSLDGNYDGTSRPDGGADERR